MMKIDKTVILSSLGFLQIIVVLRQKSLKVLPSWTLQIQTASRIDKHIAWQIANTTSFGLQQMLEMISVVVVRRIYKSDTKFLLKRKRMSTVQGLNILFGNTSYGLYRRPWFQVSSLFCFWRRTYNRWIVNFLWRCMECIMYHWWSFPTCALV
jgi:hypothetical protein